MNKNLILTVFLLPLFTNGQEPSTVKSIDSIIAAITNDASITKRIYDTVSYEKEDGTNYWDSAYSHREYFYKNGQIIKIVAWGKFANWRQDITAFYQNGKLIKYAEGEAIKGEPDYGTLNFEIYYYQDKDIHVRWLTPKPDNVVGIGSDAFLEKGYLMLKEAKND